MCEFIGNLLGFLVGRVGEPDAIVGRDEQAYHHIYDMPVHGRITCPVRFLEVDVGSPRPYNRGQFGVDGDEDGQMIARH